jgi:UTP--glucose-1-phosphate uridylyltransferase
MNKITKAVIPAAGFGTRFLPYSKAIPKEMLPIIDTPTIEYIVRECVDSGITDVLIIISPGKELIKTHFGHNEKFEEFLIKKNKLYELDVITELPKIVNVEFTYQYEQLGLGHAVLCAKEFANGDDFALLLGDDIYASKTKPATLQMIEAYNKTQSSILGTLLVPNEDVSKYGICDPEENNDSNLIPLKGVIEKPSIDKTPSNLAIGGRYILSNKIFKYLENQQKGVGDEIQLTDSILRMMAEEKVYALKIDAKRYDIGSKKGFLEATIDFALEREDLKEASKLIINKHN